MSSIIKIACFRCIYSVYMLLLFSEKVWVNNSFQIVYWMGFFYSVHLIVALKMKKQMSLLKIGSIVILRHSSHSNWGNSRTWIKNASSASLVVEYHFRCNSFWMCVEKKVKIRGVWWISHQFDVWQVKNCFVWEPALSWLRMISPSSFYFLISSITCGKQILTYHLELTLF